MEGGVGGDTSSMTTRFWINLHHTKTADYKHRCRKEGGGGGQHTLCPPPPPPPPPPNNPPTFSFNVYGETVKLDHKCTSLIYVPFTLFEGISKSMLFISILNFAILLSVFNVRNVIIWYWLGWGGWAPISLQLAKSLAPPLAPQYSIKFMSSKYQKFYCHENSNTRGKQSRSTRGCSIWITSAGPGLIANSPIFVLGALRVLHTLFMSTLLPETIFYPLYPGRLFHYQPGHLAQWNQELEVRVWYPSGHKFLFLLLLIHVLQLSVTGKSMCMKFWAQLFKTNDVVS